jgi:hypothetical protein
MGHFGQAQWFNRVIIIFHKNSNTPRQPRSKIVNQNFLVSDFLIETLDPKISMVETKILDPRDPTVPKNQSPDHTKFLSNFLFPEVVIT